MDFPQESGQIRREASTHSLEAQRFWQDFSLAYPHDFTAPGRFRFAELRRDNLFWTIGFDPIHEELDVYREAEDLLELYPEDFQELRRLGGITSQLNSAQVEFLKGLGLNPEGEIGIAEIVQVPSLVIRRGHVGGKATVTYREVIPKAGRSLRDQAVLEASKRYDDMVIEKGYAPIGLEMTNKRPMPQLANREDFVDQHSRLSGWPVWVFAKLDGERMMSSVSNGQVSKWTRSNRPIHFLEHIEAELRILSQYLPPGSVLDGELYNHDLPRQFCQSIWSRNRAGKSPHPHQYAMGYWLFDLVEPMNLDFKSRYTLLYQTYLRASQEHLFTAIFVLQPILAETYEEVLEIKNYLVSQGFEGAMIRDLGLKTEYVQGPKRTWNVIKCKSWIETDCVVTGVSDKAEGTEKGCALLNVYLPDYDLNLTGIRSRGSFEERRRWLKFPDLVIGKRCTIRFAFLTEDSQPFHPVITEVGRED